MNRRALSPGALARGKGRFRRPTLSIFIAFMIFIPAAVRIAMTSKITMASPPAAWHSA